MAPSQSRIIDKEWAESLIGLRLKVPGSWWKDEADKRRLFPCVVQQVDFEQDRRRYFQIKVLEEGDTLYPMRYDAVAGYADLDHDSTGSFQLPVEEVLDQRNARVSVARRRGGRSRRNTSADNNEDDEDNSAEARTYTMTDPDDWTMFDGNDASGYRTAESLPYTGGNEEAIVNITPEELEELKDDNGDIRFYKVFLWILARFGDNQSLFQWQCDRMQNYLVHIMKDDGFKPKYFHPENNPIKPSHVARMYGAIVANCLYGNRSVEQIWSTREVFDAVEPIKVSMPQDAWKDLARCMHFADDWEEDDDRWTADNYPAEKCAPSSDTAQHRKKHGILEDAYNKRWQEVVKAGRWLTADESRIAGWFHSAMTIGPEPKPTRTGATLHTLCVTEGELKTFKL